MQFFAGMECFFVPNDKRRHFGRSITIESAGRRWAKVAKEPFKIDVESCFVYEGDKVIGQVFESEAQWRKRQEVLECWRMMVKALPFRPSEDVSMENIRKAKKLLGVS